MVIPCYNRRDTIRASVISVQSQVGNHNIEILVVDDGSSDDSISQLADLDVKILSTGGRRGACYARNVGISKAQHEWIAFNDSDDYWRVDKLNYLDKIADFTNMDFVFHSFVRQRGRRVVAGGGMVAGIVPGGVLLRKLLKSNFISTQCILVKKNKLLECGGFDEILPRFQDWDLAIKLSKVSEIICSVPEPLSYCVELEGSISKGFQNGIFARNYLLEKYSSDYSKYFILRIRMKLGVAIRYCYAKLLEIKNGSIG